MPPTAVFCCVHLPLPPSLPSQQLKRAPPFVPRSHPWLTDAPTGRSWARMPCGCGERGGENGRVPRSEGVWDAVCTRVRAKPLSPISIPSQEGRALRFPHLDSASRATRTHCSGRWASENPQGHRADGRDRWRAGVFVPFSIEIRLPNEFPTDRDSVLRGPGPPELLTWSRFQLGLLEGHTARCCCDYVAACFC